MEPYTDTPKETTIKKKAFGFVIGQKRPTYGFKTIEEFSKSDAHLSKKGLDNILGLLNSRMGLKNYSEELAVRSSYFYAFCTHYIDSYYEISLSNLDLPFIYPSDADDGYYDEDDNWIPTGYEDIDCYTCLKSLGSAFSWYEIFRAVAGTFDSIPDGSYGLIPWEVVIERLEEVVKNLEFAEEDSKNLLLSLKYFIKVLANKNPNITVESDFHFILTESHEPQTIKLDGINYF